MRDGAMWCFTCAMLLVQHNHKNFARKHLESKKHIDNVQLGKRPYGSLEQFYSQDTNKQCHTQVGIDTINDWTPFYGISTSSAGPIPNAM